MSAKSLAAHLTGLCWAVEKDGNARGLRILQQWLNSPGKLVKPALPTSRGALTIADVAPATTAEDYLIRLRRWAGSTWAAYAELHDIAGSWVESALRNTRR